MQSTAQGRGVTDFREICSFLALFELAGNFGIFEDVFVTRVRGETYSLLVAAGGSM